MILGIGVDLVHVDRLRHWPGSPGLLERFFHAEEIAQAMKRSEDDMVLALAARFAAKEAFGKALGTGLTGIRLKEIRVTNRGSGKPDILLYGKARDEFVARGGRRIHLSLNHERDYALAMVVIEGA